MSTNERIVSRIPLQELHTLRVLRDAEADFYIPWQDLVSRSSPSPAAAFIADYTTTDTTEPKIAEIDKVIGEFIRAGHDDSLGNEGQKAFVWLHVRISQPNSNFEEARWHQDGPYMKLDHGSEDRKRTKYCFTMLGPGTMFLEQTPKLREYTPTEEFRKNRLQVAKKLADMDHFHSDAGDIVRCTWKRTDIDYSSDVHSEPRHEKDRIFFAAIWMSKTERERLTEGRK